MTFSDIFKSNFLESAVEFSALDLILSFLVATILALFIFLVYKRTFKGVMYSSSFGASLIGMTLITTFIILAITSNVILSLGMVGALSIVRFRTAVKEPLDIVFLFWSISVGIVVGAGLIPLAIIGTILIGILLSIVINKKSNETPYIVVVNSESSENEDEIISVIAGKTKRYQLKAKTINRHGSDITVEVRLKEDSGFINEILSITGVKNATMVSYNGDYMS